MDRKPFNNGGTGTAFLWNFVQGGMDMATLEKINAFLKAVNAAAWGPPLLFLLLGTGIFLTIQLRALPIRRLFFALRTAFGREARYSGEKTEAGVSPFASLMTELAAEIGTGNIVGVASAMALGGPGALGWMMLAAVVGLALKFSESFLSVQYRMQRKDGTYCGGPMVTLTRAFPGERLAKMLAVFFAGSTVLVSLGMGNMTQANSIALAMQDTFGVAREKSALVLTILLLLVVTGGLRAGTGNGTLLSGRGRNGNRSARRRASADTACDSTGRVFFPGGIGRSGGCGNFPAAAGLAVWNFPRCVFE